MHYLIIGDADSMHIFNYVKNVLLPRNYKVYILTLSSEPVRKSYVDYYLYAGVKVYSIAKNNSNTQDKKGLVHRIFNLWKKIALMHDIPHVDICHIHSVYKTAVLIALLNQKKYDRLILSYWGSEILDTSLVTKTLREKLFKQADVITLIQKNMRNIFWNNHGHMFDEKIMIADLTTEVIDCIKTISEKKSRKECRDYYHIPQDKVCLTCGYSGSSEQHQDILLQIIGDLPDEMKCRLHVVVPMQYDINDTAYLKRVEDIVAKSDIDCQILKEFVPFEVSAQLSIATDIYVHVRDHDAYSNALKEQIYSGSYTIIGEWLKYPELEEIGADVHIVSKIEDVANMLSLVLPSFTIPSEIELFQPIYDTNSTESVIRQWNNVIDIAITK